MEPDLSQAGAHRPTPAATNLNAITKTDTVPGSRQLVAMRRYLEFETNVPFERLVP